MTWGERAAAARDTDLWSRSGANSKIPFCVCAEPGLSRSDCLLRQSGKGSSPRIHPSPRKTHLIHRSFFFVEFRTRCLWPPGFINYDPSHLRKKGGGGGEEVVCMMRGEGRKEIRRERSLIVVSFYSFFGKSLLL